MIDGLYQSVLCFFTTYLTFYPSPTVSPNGRDLSDRPRMGIYVACSAVIVSNLYVLLNTYRWDWVTVLINAISSLLIFFWNGVWSSVAANAGQFYKAAYEVYGSLSFWALTLLTITMCLAPRFAAKAIQKIYYPRDIDIIREQVIMGKFKYLDNYEAYVPPAVSAAAADVSTTSSDISKPIELTTKRNNDLDDDERPIYAPSVAPTATTHNPRSPNGSDGTGYTASLDFRHRHQQSVDQGRLSYDRSRPSYDRPRVSLDRNRLSMDRVRSSFEATSDFTSAAMLTRMESTHRSSNDPFRNSMQG